MVVILHVANATIKNWEACLSGMCVRDSLWAVSLLLKILWGRTQGRTQHQWAYLCSHTQLLFFPTEFQAEERLVTVWRGAWWVLLLFLLKILGSNMNKNSSHLTIGLSGFALSSGSWTWLPSSTYTTVNINFIHKRCLIIIIEIPPFLRQLRNNSQRN